MRRSLLRWPALALLGALTVAALSPHPTAAEEEKAAGRGTAQCALEWEPGRVGGVRIMTLPFHPEPPEDVEPLETLRDGRYARIRWGTGQGLLLALDVAPGHERLFVDLDRDGDLTDETSTTWWGAGQAGVRTESVPVSYAGEEDGEGGAAGEPVPVRFQRVAGDAPDKVRITPWVHRRGRVVLGGRLRLVALLDDRADLRFDDPERAHLFVDVDGNGRFTTGSDSHEEVGLGKPFRVRGEGWKAEVLSPSGRTVRFVRVDEVPPARPRRWPRVGFPRAGAPETPPTESWDALKALFEQERGKPYANRYATIQKIGRLGTQGALALLLGVVRTETDVGVRAAAARALGNPAYLEDGGTAVVEMAKSMWSPPGVASGAIQALHGMDHPGREPVYRDLLGSNEASIVGTAARYLVYLGSEDAVQAVLREWRTGATDAVRHQIYNGLRSLSDGPPPDVVVSAASSTHTSLAARAIRDLYAIDHPETRALALKLAARRPVQEVLAKAAVDVLAAIGDAESVEALLAMAQEGTPAVELRVTRRLAPVRDPGAIDALLRGLKDKDPKVRELVAQVLAGIPEQRVTDVLMARGKRERDPAVLSALLEALGDHGDPRSVDLLLGRARKKKSDVRQAALRALARVGMREPRVRAFFLTLLSSRRWEDRVLAIDAAAATGEAKLARRILPNLGHEHRSVRQAAAEALAVLRHEGAIVPLIERLEREDEARILDAVANALYRITGLNLYDDAVLWRRWWKEEGKGFEMPETVNDLPPQDAGGTRAGFYGIPVRSGRVIFVIDQSGSMSAEDARPTTTGAPSGNRLDLAVKEVLGAVKGMKNRDFVNVILFHTTIHPWQDHLTRLTSKNRAELAKHLLQKKPTGGTNLYDGLERALLEEEVDTIFVLSDGMPGSGKYVAKEDILRAVRRLNQTKRVAIHAVSIGMDADLMKQLAAQNGGRYVRR